MNDKIFVTKPSMPPYGEFIKMIKPLWETSMLTNMGQYHKELEEKLKKYLRVNNISLMTNGHIALELAIQAMHLSGEVITTPFTFVSTIHAITRNDLKPIFCDINVENFTIDENKIEDLITEQTCAIIPVHVYGQVCNIEAIEKIAKKHGLKVIYDAAHTFGEQYMGKSVASYGDASILSFHATKVYNTVEGGAVVYNDLDYGDELYCLKNFGIRSEVLIDGIGANAKLDEIRAIMGICNLKYINLEINKREKIYNYYISELGNIKGLQLLKIQKNVKSNYAYFPIVIDDEILGFNRDDLVEELNRNNIYPRKYFYPLITATDCYMNQYNAEDTPIALKVSENVLTIPIYADLPIEIVGKICDIIKSMIAK